MWALLPTLALEPQGQLPGTRRVLSERPVSFGTTIPRKVSAAGLTRGSLWVYMPGLSGASDTATLDGDRGSPEGLATSWDGAWG